MRGLVGALMPTLIVVSILWLVVGSLTLAKRWPLKRRGRSPFTGDFLRNPGQTLLTQLDDARLDLMGYLGASVSLPLLLFSIPVTQAWWSEQPIKTGVWFIHGASILIVTVVLCVKLGQTVHRAQRLRSGYEGELAVGQELNQLLSQGFRVYHDFPADGFNIDHVVIGPTGVFAVETKARSKPMTGDGRADARVEYSGQLLKFPSWSDRKTLEQADRQAQWLHRWLSSAVGEMVAVRAVVALPGWFVKQTGRGDILVFNGKRPELVFPKVQGKGLSREMIQRVAHQVDAKCRDVTPRAYEGPLKQAS